MPYVYLAIWPYRPKMAICPYDHMAWNVANMGFSRNSYKNGAIWSRNRVDSTFWQEMRANLVRRQIFLCIFSGFPLYIPKMMATPHTCSKTHQLFFGGSWGIDTAACTSTEANKHFGAFWDTLIWILKVAGALTHDCSWSSIFLQGKVLTYSCQLPY